MSPSYQDVESAIAEVVGVAEASVRAADGSSRGRLRIRLAPGHDPDAVSQEVADLLRERFGIDIDPAAIRPRPIDPVPVPETAPTIEEAEGGEPGAASEVTPALAPEAETEAETEAAPEPSPAAAAADDESQQPAPATAAPGAPPRSALPGVDELFRPTGAGRQSAAPNGNGHGDASGERSFHRPLIRDLALGSRGLEIHAEVLLDMDGSEIRGHATGPATRRSTFRAIARATLDAVETMFPGEVKTELESIELVDDGEDERITVSVTFLTNDGADKLIGVSISRGDAEQAVMRATLDAVNRRVGLLLED